MAEQSQSNVFTELTADLLKLGKRVCFQAPGHSMYPVIKDGEVITLEPVNPLEIKKRDVILYRVSKSAVIAHRVVRIERKSRPTLHFLLRGDNSVTYDRLVESHQVLGRVVSVDRNGHDYKLNSIHAKLFFYAFLLRRRLAQIPLAKRLYVYLKPRACPVTPLKPKRGSTR